MNGMTFAREDADELKGLLSSGRGRGGDAPRRRAVTRERERGEDEGARGRVMNAVGAKAGEVRKSARGKSRLGSEGRRAATEAKTTRDVGEDEREDAGGGGGNGSNKQDGGMPPPSHGLGAFDHQLQQHSNNEPTSSQEEALQQQLRSAQQQIDEQEGVDDLRKAADELESAVSELKQMLPPLMTPPPEGV